MRRTLTVIAIVVVLAAPVAWYGWRQYSPVGVETAQPRRGTAIDAVYATGVVEPVDSSRVGPVAAGRVERLLADVGDRVQRGQVLATLDDQQVQHKLEEAQARLALAEREEARQRALIGRGAASEQALQRTESEAVQARAAMEAVRAQVADMRIVAPLDGVVISRDVDVGQSLAASSKAFVVAAPGRLRIAADVDERDIPRIRLGAAVAARAEGFPGRVFSSTVSRIYDSADSGTRTFRIEALLGADAPLRPGMTVDVNIVLSERAEALLVPATSIVRGPPRGGRPGAAAVWVVRDGRLRRVPIEAGATGPQWVEILGGLDQADQVVAMPPQSLAEGRRARAAR